MIITRTPFRVSFFGGGTDYHTWYQEHGAMVLATSINHYCYLTCRYLPPFFNYKSRIVWSMIEEVENHQDIEHPAVKAILDYLNIEQGMDIRHQGDLPARSGLGSSSAFTVGLLHALYALKGEISTKRELACEAVYIERHVLKENVGVQDQIQTAFGGLNRIAIQSNGNFSVEPLILSAERSELLQDHLMLFFTGVSRTASDIAGEKMKSVSGKKDTLHRMQAMVDEAIAILARGNDITDFGRLLDESWQLKRSIASQISPEFVDEIYDRAMKAGAIGGKLLGAGGGGFMLFFVEPEKQPQVKEALSDLLHVPFKFENGGSQVVFHDNLDHSTLQMKRRNYRHLREESPALSILRNHNMSSRRHSLELIEEKVG